MSVPPDIVRRAQAVLATQRADFATLAKVAELDPKRDFIGADLSGVDFGAGDLSAFYFREANLVGANLSRARGVTVSMLSGAKFDRSTTFPGVLQSAVSTLTHFWKDGCPSFVSMFGVDEFGQWFEFEIEGPDGPVTQRMRWIAPGKFLMGSPKGEHGRTQREGPQHEVMIGTGFWLFDTACTQALWTAIMGKNPSLFRGEDRPVEKVSWIGAKKFIATLNERVPGLNLSLPSEAQWEYACRAGTATPFSFGEDITPEQVNYDGNFPYKEGKMGLYRAETVAAGSLPANPWGLHEMHGNVWEWCADAWHENYAPTDGSVCESEDNAAVRRVVRGGSWFDSALLVRSAFRDGSEPGLRNDGGIGFRCARVQDGAEPVETRRIRQAERRIAAAPSGGAARAVNGRGVEIFPHGAPLILRGAGVRRPVKPGWASAIGRDHYGDWAEISVGKARQRMRLITPGKFLMGSPEGEAGRFPDEGPQHEVEIKKSFWLFDTPCTQSLWTAVMGQNPSRFESEDRPVEQVSWNDAKKFIAKINKLIPNLNLSLPSEAQWEYACRAGTKGMSYAGDLELLTENSAPGLDAIAWYGGNSGRDFDIDEGYESSAWPDKQYDHMAAGTRRVRQKLANAYGLYDMLGNVWEWVEDDWHDNYEGAPTDGSTWDVIGLSDRIVRGGSWDSDARDVRSACRGRDEPTFYNVNIGFRCARVQA